jgi:hypothetical protein
MPEPITVKLGTYIMAPEPILTAYSINPSDQSVSVCVSPIVAGQKRYHGKENTSKIRKIVGRVILYAVRVI